MIKWTIISCTICTSLCAGFSINPVQGAQHDSLRIAALVFEREAYVATTNEARTTALMGRAACLEQLKDYTGARETLLRVNHFALADTLSAEVRHKAALYAYLTQEFEQCNAQLLQLEQMAKAETSRDFLLLYALSLNECRQWNAAKEKLQTWIDHHYANDPATADSLRVAVEHLYRSKKQPRYVNPERASLFSLIVPGSGQLYAGYLLDAAFSAGMVLTGVGVAAYGVFIAKYYVTGVLTGYVITERFRTSGTKRAEFLANKRNFKSARKYNDKLKAVVLDL